MDISTSTILQFNFLKINLKTKNKKRAYALNKEGKELPKLNKYRFNIHRFMSLLYFYI